MSKQEGTRTMFQGRFHGRGGQGVVTAAELLASAAFRDDRYAQAFPSFGPWNTSTQLPKERESGQVPVDAAPTGKRVLVVGRGAVRPVRRLPLRPPVRRRMPLRRARDGAPAVLGRLDAAAGDAVRDDPQEQFPLAGRPGF